MKRGEFYLVCKPGSQDPRKQRVFVIVSRQTLADSRFSTLICAPVYSRHDGLSTQVPVGTAEGLKKESSIHCDELVSLPEVRSDPLCRLSQDRRVARTKQCAGRVPRLGGRTVCIGA